MSLNHLEEKLDSDPLESEFEQAKMANEMLFEEIRAFFPDQQIPEEIRSSIECRMNRDYIYIKFPTQGIMKWGAHSVTPMTLARIIKQTFAKSEPAKQE